MSNRTCSRLLLVAAAAGLAWWTWPAAVSTDAAPPASGAPAASSHAAGFASPLAPSAPAAAGRSANDLFALGAQGELIFDQRSAERLDALAQSLPRDLSEDELVAIDEYAAAGLEEPAAGEARRVVRDYLARRGIGIAAIAPPPVHAVPEVMPDALLAARPPQPEGDGMVRYPGMGDETN